MNKKSFYNPISNVDAPDPFMTYDVQSGYYYALFTCSDRLELYRSKIASDIVRGGDSRIIYDGKTSCGSIECDIWAPEMHKGSNGKWYIYSSGRRADEKYTWHIFIMECLSDDPFGEWRFVGCPSPGVRSIDPTIYTDKAGRQHLCCSRFDKEQGQVLHLYEMKDPCTFGECNATISVSTLEWELVPPHTGRGAIQEGPFFLEHDGRLFLIYSANGCSSDRYCLGVLELVGENMYEPSSWKKHERPILTMGNGVYGTGHASFFRSPEGREIWCAYHARKDHSDHKSPYYPRYFYIQRVGFDENGVPFIGVPTSEDTLVVSPAGETEF